MITGRLVSRVVSRLVSRSAVSIVAIATLASMAHPASAQVAYRCGNSYSQEPCPQARAIDIGDSRSADQRTQAQRVAELDRRLLDELRSERAAREAQAAPAIALNRPQRVDTPLGERKHDKRKTEKRPRVSKIRWVHP